MRYDVIVIGGGAAGLAGALALARARRSVLVVDGGQPRNAAAGHVHNFLTRDGTPPADLLALGRDEVRGYGAEIITGTVTAAKPGFTVSLADGTTHEARRLLVTTGLVDVLPDIPGLGALGGDVLHCPYCHGWEVRDQAIGVIATSPMAVHQALLWRQWSADVTLFLNGGPAPGTDEAAQLRARGIRVVPETIVDTHAGVRLADGTVVARDALVVATHLVARDEVLAGLGLAAEPVEMAGHVIGTAVPADPTGATSVPGVWVAGNVADPRAQVITSAAAGLTAGAAINADLVADDTRAAMAGSGSPMRQPG